MQTVIQDNGLSTAGNLAGHPLGFLNYPLSLALQSSFERLAGDDLFRL